MSKLEEQKALPRRKLFRMGDALHTTGPIDCSGPIHSTGGIAHIPAKPKRKAKKAKGKR